MEIANKIDISIDDDKTKFLYHINKKEDINQKTHLKILKIIILITCIFILAINPKEDKINLINDNNQNNSIIFNNKANSTNMVIVITIII